MKEQKKSKFNGKNLLLIISLILLWPVSTLIISTYGEADQKSALEYKLESYFNNPQAYMVLLD